MNSDKAIYEVRADITDGQNCQTVGRKWAFPIS